MDLSTFSFEALCESAEELIHLSGVLLAESFENAASIVSHYLGDKLSDLRIYKCELCQEDLFRDGSRIVVFFENT